MEFLCQRSHFLLYEPLIDSFRPPGLSYASGMFSSSDLLFCNSGTLLLSSEGTIIDLSLVFDIMLSMELLSWLSRVGTAQRFVGG